MVEFIWLLVMPESPAVTGTDPRRPPFRQNSFSNDQEVRVYEEMLFAYVC